MKFQSNSTFFWNFVIFDIWKIRFYDFRPKIWVVGTFLGTIEIFSESIIINLFQKKKMAQLTRHIRLSSRDFVFFPNFSYIDIWPIFICGSIAEYSRVSKITSSKSMKLQLSNALSNVPIALLVPEISWFEIRKSPQ